MCKLKILQSNEMTVDEWFGLWIEMIRGYRKPQTVANYTNYYNNNIHSVIGQMNISDVKPIHCSLVLQNMIENYKPSSIKQVRVAMSCMFQYAFDNDMILKNPVGKSVTVPYSTLLDCDQERHLLLTPSEVPVFLANAVDSKYYLQYCLVLETGLRASELIGLTLDEIDLDENIIHIKHALHYEAKKGWYFLAPKSKHGKRDIYMTPRCHEIIESALKNRQKFEAFTEPQFKNLLFFSRECHPVRLSAYNMGLIRICKRAELKNISMHSLRHTFATRCVLAGINPKVLQTIMGHSDISTTMNIYVHVTETFNREEMKKLVTYNELIGL